MPVADLSTELGVVNAQLCAGVPEDLSRARSLTLVAAVVGPLGIIAILMRTYSRWAITKQMGSDDWTMLAAGVFLVGVLACNFLSMLRFPLVVYQSICRFTNLQCRCAWLWFRKALLESLNG
jgi:hypothetical protein